MLVCQLLYFAEQGFNVIGVEINEEKISKINQGISTIGELGLDSRLSDVVQDKKLIATSNLIDSTKNSDVILIIVPTPVTKSKDPNLSHIISAGR